MEEVFGGIRARPPVAMLSWKIGIRLRGVVPAFDDTCLRDTISRRLHPHGFHLPSSLAGKMPVCPTE
jgi:hypothetical protein